MSNFAGVGRGWKICCGDGVGMGPNIAGMGWGWGPTSRGWGGVGYELRQRGAGMVSTLAPVSLSTPKINTKTDFGFPDHDQDLSKANTSALQIKALTR